MNSPGLFKQITEFPQLYLVIMEKLFHGLNEHSQSITKIMANYEMRNQPTAQSTQSVILEIKLWHRITVVLYIHYIEKSLFLHFIMLILNFAKYCADCINCAFHNFCAD